MIESYEGKHKLEFEVFKDECGWGWKPVGGPVTWAVRHMRSAAEAYRSATAYDAETWRKWSKTEQPKEVDERGIKIWHEAAGWYWRYYDVGEKQGPFASRKDATDDINQKSTLEERTVKIWWDGSKLPWRWAFFNGNTQVCGSYGVASHEGVRVAIDKAIKLAENLKYKITHIEIKHA